MRPEDEARFLDREQRIARSALGPRDYGEPYILPPRKTMNTCDLIDINHDNPFDPALCVKQGIPGVIHKCSEGTYFRDPLYTSRKAQALQAGLLWGAYHFMSGEDVQNQLTNLIMGAGVSQSGVLLCLDWEVASDGSTATEEQVELLSLLVLKAFGRYPAIYGGYTIRESKAIHTLNPTLAKCPLWYQRYANMGPPTSLPIKGFPSATWKSISILQYSDGSGQYGDPSYYQQFPGSDWNRVYCSPEELKAKWPNLN